MRQSKPATEGFEMSSVRLLRRLKEKGLPIPADKQLSRAEMDSLNNVLSTDQQKAISAHNVFYNSDGHKKPKGFVSLGNETVKIDGSKSVMGRAGNKVYVPGPVDIDDDEGIPGYFQRSRIAPVTYPTKKKSNAKRKK